MDHQSGITSGKEATAMLIPSDDSFLFSYERVVITGKAYRLIQRPDDFLFEQFLFKNDKEIANKNQSLCIKKNEILFARKCSERGSTASLAVRRNFCPTYQSTTFKILNSKQISKICAEKMEPSSTTDNSNHEEPQQQEASDDNKNNENCRIILKNTVEIYLLARKNRYRWRMARTVCSFKCEKTADRFVAYIRGIISGTNRPKNVLIFVNPFGGKKRALKIYEQFVEPIFKCCHIRYTLITTERRNHARDIVLNDDLSAFDGIVSVGGDGLFNEVLNGLLIRTQRDANLDINDTKVDFKSTPLRLAAIPAGSTNALAHTVHGTEDPLTAVLHVVIGDSRGLDVCAVHAGDSFRMFACIAVAYGFFGDVLKHSEEMRWLGPPRYLLAGLKMLLSHTTYLGSIAMKLSQPSLPINGNNNQRQLHSLSIEEYDSLRCSSDCALCPINNDYNNMKNQDNKERNIKQRIETPTVVNDQHLLHLVGAITPVVSRFAPGGISPSCHLGDGRMHLIVVSPISRCANGKFIGSVMGSCTRGSHLIKSYVRFNEVSEFSFTPKPMDRDNEKRIDTDDNNENSNNSDGENSNSQQNAENDSPNNDNKKQKHLGAWNLDGELMMSRPNEILHFKLHRQLITMFARGVEIKQSDATNSTGCIR